MMELRLLLEPEEVSGRSDTLEEMFACRLDTFQILLLVMKNNCRHSCKSEI